MPSAQLGRYLLTERLATGGTAEIFKAKLVGIEGFEKTVVIKRILPHWSANTHFITMLIDEAKIMVRLNHERVVQVYELGKDEETYYMVMEYVEGTDLRHLARQSVKLGNPLKPNEASFIIAEVLRGLDYIHKQKDEKGHSLNIVHRDISPQNILLSQEGAIKIADFGIAHATSRSYETATGILKGKFAYMSPEQATGGIINAQTDIFATGIMFYELLVGKKLFDGKSDLEVLDKVRRFQVEDYIPKLPYPELLKKVLAHALHPNLHQRYATPHDFWKELMEVNRTLGYWWDADELALRVQQIQQKTKPVLELSPSRGSGTAAFPPKETKENLEPVSILSAPIVAGERSLIEEPDEITHSFHEIEMDAQEALETSSKRKTTRWVLVGIASIVVLFVFVQKVFFSPQKNVRLPSPSPSFSLPPHLAGVVLPGGKIGLLGIEEKGFSSAVPERAAQILYKIKDLKEEQRIKEKQKELAEKKALEREKMKERSKEREKEKQKKLEANREENTEKEAPLKPSEINPRGEGVLSVSASPYGLISVAGVASNREHNFSQRLRYGNYTVTVSYKSMNGWVRVSRTARLNKASVVCRAAFSMDGEKKNMSCN